MGSSHVIGGATNRAFEKMANSLLQDADGWQANGVFEPFGFEELVNFGIGEASVVPRLSGLAWAEGKVELGGASDWAGGGLF
jgi:hypothetical protein